MKVSHLRGGNRAEQGPIRLDIQQRRAVEAIKAAHKERSALDALEPDD